jgi:hypothetical protein
MNSTKADFEKVAKKHGLRLTQRSGIYLDGYTAVMWEGWRAAMGFIHNNLPDCPEEDTGFALGFEDMKFQVEELTK